MMDDENHPDLTVYSEDQSAAYLARAIIAGTDDLVQRVQFVAAGPANLVRLLGVLAAEDKMPTKSVGLLDGDQGAAKGCLVLPGGSESPERVVFGAIASSARWGDLGARIGIPAASIQEKVLDAMNLQDAHRWTRHISDSLNGLLTANRVWEEAVDFYVAEILDASEKEAFVSSVTDVLT
jgi:hypothetical protein